MIDDMEITDFLEVVILCLSLLIVIPILMIIWIDCDRIEKKRRNRWK
nr:MAG TPA: cellulose biosynthesis protein [Caudoviricetes sp.]